MPMSKTNDQHYILFLNFINLITLLLSEFVGDQLMTRDHPRMQLHLCSGVQRPTIPLEIILHILQKIHFLHLTLIRVQHVMFNRTRQKTYAHNI